jgi:hypothetical protein
MSRLGLVHENVLHYDDFTGELFALLTPPTKTSSAIRAPL